MKDGTEHQHTHVKIWGFIRVSQTSISDERKNKHH